MKRTLVLALVIALVLVAGVIAVGLFARPRVTQADIPLYPAAQESTFEGAFEIPLDLVATEVQLALRERYGPADNEIYTLPPGADWEAIQRFYGGEFAKDGWRLDDELSRLQHDKYKMAVWKRGLLDPQAVAVVLVPQPGGTDNDYLLVLVTR